MVRCPVSDNQIDASDLWFSLPALMEAVIEKVFEVFEI